MTNVLEVEKVLVEDEFIPCDVCQHRSIEMAVKEDSSLTFCSHHAHKNRIQLEITGWILSPYIQGE